MFKKKNKALFIVYVILSSLLLPDIICNFMNELYWKGIQSSLIMMLISAIGFIYLLSGREK